MSGDGGSSPQKICQKCEDPHDQLDCPMLPCSRCSGTRHTRFLCKSPSGVEICFKCGNIGHLAYACTNLAPVGRCGVCGGYGHGGPSNQICATTPVVPMCAICRVPHRPQDCQHRRDEFPDWKGLDACTQCGEKGHVFADCPEKF